ncbi:pyrimidodiazepine synthase-like [Hermetia illucens]|nr:pyrimidodiazepine synthase-like [Hermetia illucens]
MSNGRHLSEGDKLPDLPKDGKLRLYSMRFCPYAQRIHLILDAKDIPYHSIYINLGNKPGWFLDKSPTGKVPALELTNESGNPTIIESLIIAEYLDEKYPKRPMYPKDPLLKARDRILIDQFNSVISSMYKIFLQDLEEVPGAITNVVKGLDLYEKELRHRGTEFFNGKQPGMLDYMIWPWCERCDMLPYLVGDKYQLDDKRFEKLIKWRTLMKEDSAVQRSIISGTDHANYIKSRRAGRPDYDMLVIEGKRQRVA